VFVPAVWRLEVVNALVVAERRKKIAPAKNAKFWLDLQRLAITIDIDGTCKASWPSFRKDEPLRKAAREIGVEIFGLYRHNVRIRQLYLRIRASFSHLLIG
jgi:hypothetical protein